MSFSVNVAADVIASTLEGFQHPKDPKDILQHVANKPLLRKLMDAKVEFGSAGPAVGTTTPANVREPVMGALMKDQSGSYAGIAGADVLVFKSSDGAIQTTCPVRWMHAGFQITHEELLYQGVHVSKDNSTKSTADDRAILFDALELKKADYMESIMFNRDQALHLDGTQDAKAIAGIASIIVDDPTLAGQTILGISSANTWWRSVSRTGVGGALPKLAYSKADQTMTETIIHDFRTLTTYGGNPDMAVGGSDAIDAIVREMRAKGMNTVTGWNDKKNNIGVKGIILPNGTELEFDPTLDRLGQSKVILAWDSSKLRLQPQRGEWGKVTNQNQPADQFVMLISTTDRGVLTCKQMDCQYKAVLG
jgi:hypothetical protein